MMSKRTTTTTTPEPTTATSLDHKVSTDKISSLIRVQSGISAVSSDQLAENASNSEAQNHRNTKKIIDILSKTQQARNGETLSGSGGATATTTTTTKVAHESGWTKTPICQIMRENEKLNGGIKIENFLSLVLSTK